jgi:predicted metal-dependent HD superfamily phosphohydrolase
MQHVCRQEQYSRSMVSNHSDVLDLLHCIGIFTARVIGSFTHRAKPSQVSSAKHPSTACDEKAGEILDADGKILASKKQSVSDHAQWSAENAGQESARKSVAEITCNTIDDAAPGEDWDGEVLAFLDAVIKAEAENNGQEYAEAVEYCQAHDLNDTMQPSLGIFDCHHEFRLGILCLR